jgi:hypothetical protein
LQWHGESALADLVRPEGGADKPGVLGAGVVPGKLAQLY